MQCAAAAFVPGVQRCQHVDDLSASHLAHDQPVGAHPEGLPDQVVQADPPNPFDVRRSGLHPNDMWMRRVQLGGVFHQNDAFRRIRGCEQGAKNGGLANPAEMTPT